MKCPKCNNEIADGSTVCNFCGASLEKEAVAQEELNTQEAVESPVAEPVVEKTVVEEPVVEKTQTASETVSHSVSPEPKAAPSKGRPSIITILGLIAAVVIIALVVLYFTLFSTNAKKIYNNMIKEGVESLFASEAVYSNQIISEAEITFNTDVNELKEADGTNAKAKVQLDVLTQQLGVDLKASTSKDNLIDVKAMVDLAGKKAYLAESNLYDKSVYLDIPDEVTSVVSQVVTLGEDRSSTKATSKKIAKIINNTIIENIPAEAYSSEKTKLTIDGKTKKYKNYKLTLESKQVEDIMLETVKSLKANEEFLNCYKDKDQVIVALDAMIDSLEEVEGEGTIVLNYYVSGMFNSFKEMDIVFVGESGDQVVFAVEKTDKKTYKLTFSTLDENGEEYSDPFTAVMVVEKMEKDDFDFTIEVETEKGNVGAHLVSSVKYNQPIDTSVMNDAVNVQEMSEEDLEGIIEKMDESPVYSELTYYLEDALGYGDDPSEEEGPIDCVESYSDEIVHFTIPDTFKHLYGSTSYQAFEKEGKEDSGDVTVWVRYATEDEYYQELKDDMDSLGEDGSYKDMKVSEPVEVTVGGRTFKKVETSYKYASGSYDKEIKRVYYYSALDDDNTYAVEFTDHPEVFTEDEIEDLLTITIK